MKISFVINSRRRKDDKQNVRIRVSDGRDIKPIMINTPINIFKEFWNKDTERVTNKHQDHAIINRGLKKYKDRREHCENKFDNGEFTFRQVGAYMEGRTNYATVDAFVDTVMRKGRKFVTWNDYRDKLNIIKGHMNISGGLRWKDVNRSWYTELHDILKKKNLSKNSIASYSIAMGSIFREAKEEGVIQEEPIRPKAFRRGVTSSEKTRKYKATEVVSTEKVERAIIEAKNHPQLQSVVMWLLQFCLRGFYPADIVKMTEAELDTPNYLKVLKNELYITHYRSKEEGEATSRMYIRVDRWTTRRLIDYLKFSVAYTHHQPRRRDIVADINDELKIYDYDVDKDVKKHLYRMALHTRRVRKYGMSMKNARKTFTNVADEEDISEKLKKYLVGRISDPIFDKSYSNKETDKMRTKIDDAHKKILNAFNIPKLVDMVWARANALNGPVWLKNKGPVYGINRLSTGEETNAEKVKFLLNSHKDYSNYKWYWKNYSYEEKYELTDELKKELEIYLNEWKEREKSQSKIIKLYPNISRKVANESSLMHN